MQLAGMLIVSVKFRGGIYDKNLIETEKEVLLSAYWERFLRKISQKANTDQPFCVSTSMTLLLSSYIGLNNNFFIKM